ncbi:hypothetical protein V1527DRAFT_485972 [Lipomyces starkeyi]
MPKGRLGKLATSTVIDGDSRENPAASICVRSSYTYWWDLSVLLAHSHNGPFELLKRLCVKMFSVTREDTKAKFQPLLGKVMVVIQDYFYEVQELATLETYATTWAKVLWVGCLAITNTGRLHQGLELTDEQRAAAMGLVQDHNLLKGARENVGGALESSVVMFSTHVRRQQFD